MNLIQLLSHLSFFFMQHQLPDLLKLMKLMSEFFSLPATLNIGSTYLNDHLYIRELNAAEIEATKPTASGKLIAVADFQFKNFKFIIIGFRESHLRSDVTSQSDNDEQDDAEGDEVDIAVTDPVIVDAVDDSIIGKCDDITPVDDTENYINDEINTVEGKIEEKSDTPTKEEVEQEEDIIPKAGDIKLINQTKPWTLFNVDDLELPGPFAALSNSGSESKISLRVVVNR